MPTPMRASFIMWNICARPWFGCADQVADASAGLAEFQEGVDDAALAELVVDAGQAHVVARAARAVGVDQNRGTTNRLMPFTPAGAPAIFASTRCTMFSASSWSPPEIHIFAPRRR